MSLSICLPSDSWHEWWKHDNTTQFRFVSHCAIKPLATYSCTVIFLPIAPTSSYGTTIVWPSYSADVSTGFGFFEVRRLVCGCFIGGKSCRFRKVARRWCTRHLCRPGDEWERRYSVMWFIYFWMQCNVPVHSMRSIANDCLGNNDDFNRVERTYRYVGTVHSMHKTHCLMMLQAGKAVLCEKPCTLNASDTREVVAAAQAKGVFFAEAVLPPFLLFHYSRMLTLKSPTLSKEFAQGSWCFGAVRCGSIYGIAHFFRVLQMWTRYTPIVIEAAKRIHRGDIGEIVLVQSDFGFSAFVHHSAMIFFECYSFGSIVILLFSTGERCCVGCGRGGYQQWWPHVWSHARWYRHYYLL